MGEKSYISSSSALLAKVFSSQKHKSRTRLADVHSKVPDQEGFANPGFGHKNNDIKFWKFAKLDFSKLNVVGMQ
jgi:hypothetical protein